MFSFYSLENQRFYPLLTNICQNNNGKITDTSIFRSDFSNRKNRTKTHDFKCEYKNKPNKNLEKVNMQV